MWSGITLTLPAVYVLRPGSLPAAEISAELSKIILLQTGILMLKREQFLGKPILGILTPAVNLILNILKTTPLSSSKNLLRNCFAYKNVFNRKVAGLSLTAVSCFFLVISPTSCLWLPGQREHLFVLCLHSSSTMQRWNTLAAPQQLWHLC